MLIAETLMLQIDWMTAVMLIWITLTTLKHMTIAVDLWHTLEDTVGWGDVG